MKRLSVHVEMMDGRVLETKTSLRDYVLYETTAKRQRPPWGGVADNPSRWEAFVSWAALRRTGHYAGTFEAFVDEADLVDASVEEPVDPTPPDPGDG